MTHRLLFLLLLGICGPAASAGAPCGQEPVAPGLSKSDPYTPLEVGHSLEVTQPTMLHWKMPAGEAYVLTIKPREHRRDLAYVYLAASRLASEEDYDTEWIVNAPWSLTLDAFSRPRLTAGGELYVFVKAMGTLDVSLEVGVPNPPLPLQALTQVALPVHAFAYQTYRLDGLRSFKYLVIYQSVVDESIALLAADAPIKLGDWARKFFPSMGLRSETQAFDLARFNGADTLYLTLNNAQYVGTGQVSWQGVDELPEGVTVTQNQ